jgi:hypothetical protein
MHIHRPKALQSAREILTEIGVVAIGIAIALGGEQLIEAQHWRDQVAASEAALKVAYAREARNIAQRQAAAPCVESRLAALSKIVSVATDNGRLPAIGPIGAAPYKPWLIGAWEAVVASQTVSHLPREKMLAYVQINQEATFIGGLTDREAEQWTILGSIAGPGRRLSDVEAEALRVALAQAAEANQIMIIDAANLGDRVRATGLVEPSVFADEAKRAEARKSTWPICQPLTTQPSSRP